jgi:hypothetical protein
VEGGNPIAFLDDLRAYHGQAGSNPKVRLPTNRPGTRLSFPFVSLWAFRRRAQSITTLTILLFPVALLTETSQGPGGIEVGTKNRSMGPPLIISVACTASLPNHTEPHLVFDQKAGSRDEYLLARMDCFSVVYVGNFERFRRPNGDLRLICFSVAVIDIDFVSLRSYIERDEELQIFSVAACSSNLVRPDPHSVFTLKTRSVNDCRAARRRRKSYLAGAIRYYRGRPERERRQSRKCKYSSGVAIG